MQEEAVIAADVVAHLTRGLQERQRLNVTDGAADLGYHDVDVGPCHRPDAFLDLVRDVRDHLDGVSQVVPAPLLRDDLRVDLTGGHVSGLAEIDVEKPFVVTDIEVGLGAVVGDEHFAVLERVHRARVDIEVGIQLLHGDPKTPGLQQSAEARRCQALAEGRRHSARDEQMFGGRPGQRMLPWEEVCGEQAARPRDSSLPWTSRRVERRAESADRVRDRSGSVRRHRRQGSGGRRPS